MNSQIVADMYRNNVGFVNKNGDLIFFFLVLIFSCFVVKFIIKLIRK